MRSALQMNLLRWNESCGSRSRYVTLQDREVEVEIEAQPKRHSDSVSSVKARGEARQARRGRRRWRLYAARVLVGVCACIAWQAMSGRIIRPFWISSPLGVGRALEQGIANGSIVSNTVVTLEEAVLGFIVGVLLGALVGFALGRARLLGEVLEPYIIAVYSLPKIAIAPLFLLWLGIGFRFKFFMAMIGVFFLVFFSAYAAVRRVNQELINAVELMGAHRRDILRYVEIPSAASAVFLGMQMALPFALIGAVIAEILASNHGLGYLLESATNGFDTTGAFVVLVVLMAIAMALDGVIRIAEHWLVPWLPEREGRRERVPR